MAGRGITSVLKYFHLRPISSIQFTFDPYSANVRSIREMLSIVHYPKVLTTNDRVAFKVDVKGNRCEPEMKVDFVDGTKAVFKTQNLSTLEILTRLNNFTTLKDVKKDDSSPITSKLEKKKRKK